MRVVEEGAKAAGVEGVQEDSTEGRKEVEVEVLRPDAVVVAAGIRTAHRASTPHLPPP